jgi:hypothetical protein
MYDFVLFGSAYAYQRGSDVGRAAPTPPDRGLPPLVSPLNNLNAWVRVCDHAQRAYRMFVVSHMVYKR